MDGTSGYAVWALWAVIAVGTAAFWVVTFLTVRMLLVGGRADEPTRRDVHQGLHPLDERLRRGDITVEEYVHQVDGGDTDTNARHRVGHSL